MINQNYNKESWDEFLEIFCDFIYEFKHGIAKDGYETFLEIVSDKEKIKDYLAGAPYLYNPFIVDDDDGGIILLAGLNYLMISLPNASSSPEALKGFIELWREKESVQVGT